MPSVHVKSVCVGQLTQTKKTTKTKKWNVTTRGKKLKLHRKLHQSTFQMTIFKEKSIISDTKTINAT